MTTDFTALLADESPDAAIITTIEGVVLHWSKGAESIFRYTEAEALGHTLHDLIAPENRDDEERRIHRETLATGYAMFESLRRTKDGSLIYVDTSHKVVHVNDREVLCSAVIRVTAHCCFTMPTMRMPGLPQASIRGASHPKSTARERAHPSPIDGGTQTSGPPPTP